MKVRRHGKPHNGMRRIGGELVGNKISSISKGQR
ncbi:hypothetical protein DEU45_13724 [Bacillus sp. AG102]|uniref:Uncharacterized protein n=1 Tax=Bacillus thuringiensis subsp. israelensis TaxID=1430 RepID=A0AAX3HYL1_BACTI|nr:hypothetical protein DEU45_13724 [Bacillus sp. AG102]TWE59188.1 hypothetical protein FHW38_1264 [Bacillus thuringiensis]TWG35388.1 hypothetical protein FHX98_5827 [Bacillus sp. AK8]VIJ07909.1 hypothetical protein BTAR23_AR23_06006 [Bacillus thuringiensis serovar israelensis]